MKKLFISLTLVGLVHTSSSVMADVTDTAFSDKLLESAQIKAMPKSEVIEAPAQILSSAENETFIATSDSTNPALVSKEYAGTQVWGKLCNIVNTPSGQYKWSINRYDLETGAVETIFGVTNNRKIQSVMCEPSGYGVLFSMKETLGGDYEIYSLNPGEENPLQKLTDNDTDDVDVTASWDGSAIAWQNRLADGRQAILLSRENTDREFLPIVKSLASASPFVQPSLSANGKWLTFVQLRPSFFAVMRYDIENNKYLEVRKVPRRKRLFHPSISNDGNIIGWAENLKQNRYMVKNLADNTLTQLLNNSNGIEHASVSANGDLVAYSVNADAKRQTYMTSLDTLATTRIGDILYGTNRYLGTSWLGTSLQALQLEDVSGQAFVSLDGPFLLSFNGDGSGTEISNGDGEYSNYPAPYAEDFSWTVNSGQLLVNYENEASTSVEVSLATVTDNIYTIVGEDSDGDSGVSDLYKALPLSIADLDGKVVSLSVSEDSSCSLITFSFEGTTALGSSVCDDDEGEIDINYYDVTTDPSIDNILVLTRAEETLYIMLASGSISDNQGTLAFIDQDADGSIDAVITRDVTFNDKSLASLIAGKTLYQHVTLDGNHGVATFEVTNDGSEGVFTELGQNTDTFLLEIFGDTLFRRDNQLDDPSISILIESNDTYIQLSNGLDDTTTFYFTRADALAGPVDYNEGSSDTSGGNVPVITSTQFTQYDATSGKISVLFSENMQTNDYSTSGDYFPTSSEWLDSRTFVMELSSFSPGGSITFRTEGFKSTSGEQLAEDHTFVFPQ